MYRFRHRKRLLYFFILIPLSDYLCINTSQMLYNINDYEYQINELNQYLLIFIIHDMIQDINYIIKRQLSPSEEFIIGCYIINSELVYKNSIDILNKINKRLEKK